MKALVLAGGFDQMALINELKSRGYYVILADYYKYPIAKAVADKHVQISTLDIEKVKELALAEQVSLITTACTDQALLTVAYVSECLNLPCYLDYETARNVTNKEYMKQRFVEFDIPTAKHVIIENMDDLDKHVSSLTFPLVVKPADCNSSKGVYKVCDLSSLHDAVQNAIVCSRTNTAIVEDFISGTEYTVDFWIDHGEPKLLMVSEITKFKNEYRFTINGCRTLPDLSEPKLSTLNSIAKQIANAFSLDNMPMFMQVIDNSNGIYVLEFSARMGGGTKYRMVELYSGVPIMKLYAERITGHTPTIRTALTRCYMLLHFIYCKPGTFKELKGIDELIACGVVDEWYQYKTSGTFFDKAETSGDRVAGLLFTGDTEKDLTDKQAVALRQLSVLSQESQDIMLRTI